MVSRLRCGGPKSGKAPWVNLDGLSHLYDERARIETEIKADKGGLLLPKRRKKQFEVQEALILLTDLAHNILAWSRDF